MQASADGQRLVVSVANPVAGLASVPILGDRVAEGTVILTLEDAGAAAAPSPVRPRPPVSRSCVSALVPAPGAVAV